VLSIENMTSAKGIADRSANHSMIRMDGFISQRPVTNKGEEFQICRSKRRVAAGRSGPGTGDHDLLILCFLPFFHVARS
jgi:hypothetical protein